MSSNIPSFSFAQFIVPVSSPEQLASGGAGGAGGSAASEPRGVSYGSGGAGGTVDSHGGSALGGNALGLTDGGGTGSESLLGLLGLGTDGGTAGTSTAGNAVGGAGASSAGGAGGAGPSSSVASSATAGAGAAGGAGGATSADQTVTPTNTLDFADSFKTEDNDGVDFKHATIRDSFNTHSGGVDTSHGVVSHSVVAGGDVADSGNSLHLTSYQDSGNVDAHQSYSNVGNHTYLTSLDNVANDRSLHVDHSGNTDSSSHVGHDVSLGNTFEPNLLDIDLPVNLPIDLSGLLH